MPRRSPSKKSTLASCASVISSPGNFPKLVFRTAFRFLSGISIITVCTVDGFISGAAAMIAYHLEPQVKNYLIASHCSVEIGHKIILDHLGIVPFLDLNFRLGEGTGAALGINLVEAGIKIMTQMASFKSAGVSEKT